MFDRLTETAIRWAGDEEAVATAEFGLVFPVMFAMMLGIWDLGNGILANQKAIAASEIVVDLIGRQESIDDDELAQAFQAGALAMAPFPTDSLVIDVASIEYDSDDDPQILWQEDSTGATGDPDLVDKTVGLGVDGDGAIVVQVSYEYDPLFSGLIIGTIEMRERMFSRGRQSTLVERD